MNPTQHECPDCGYAWLHGQHGGHSCKDRLLARIAEQARDIASKQATINGMNEAHWKVVQELAALKAQPNGVACANDWFLSLPPERQAVLREDKWLLADAAFKAGKSLNSSPVSAGKPEKCSYQDDPRSPSELSLAGCNCVRFGEGNPHWPCKLHPAASAVVVDDRAAFEAAIEASSGMRPGNYSPDYDRYVSERLQGQYEGWKLARALTASAPNHSEQVRQMVLEELLTRCAEWCDKQPKQPWYGRTAGDMVRTFMACQPLAAAPSAGSQGGDA